MSSAMMQSTRQLRPTRITGPGLEPVSIDELRAQARISHNEEDALIYQYIRAAREYWEERTETTVHETTLDLVLDSWPCGDEIILPRATPLIAVVSTTLTDSDGNPVIWDPATWIVDVDSAPGRIVRAYGEGWPAFTAYPVSPIKIRYRAGIAASSPATEADAVARQAVLLIAAAAYQNREAEVITDRAIVTASMMNYGVEAMINARLIKFTC